MKYLSLCIPTNGISEWIFPVLDNIFRQNADRNEWEIIVTDNGNNEDFMDRMKSYASERDNLIYKKTDAFMFENQIEALRLAQGTYLKFLNHRSILEPGAIQWMIDLIKKNMDEKPIMYLSTGALKMQTPQVYSDFDGFVRGLREMASWTTGVGVWKSDFDNIPKNWTYSRISPHSDVLFWVRDRGKYIIDDRVWCHEIDNNHIQKGKYDLYRAFAVDEIAVILKLYSDNSISSETLKYIIRCYEKYVAYLYMQFNLLHRPCSYALDGFEESMGVFLNKRKVLIRAYINLLEMALKKLLNINR